MIERLLLLNVLLFSLPAYAQTPVYYDELNFETDSAHATHFRLTRFEPTKGLHKVEEYYLDGTRKAIEYMTEDKDAFHGPHIAWFRSGQVSDSGNYVDNKRQDLWRFFFENGQLAAEIIFDRGEVSSQKYWDPDGSVHSDTIDVNVQALPLEGLEKFYDFVARNLKYPKIARKSGITGMVYVGLVIDTKGEVSYMRIVKGLGDLFDQAALKAVSGGPKWNPGKQYNRYVVSRVILPVKFNGEK